MKQLLIFGVGGFVGRYLAEEFRNFGYDVYGTDIVQTPSIPGYVRFLQCDILNAQAVAELIEAVKPTHIINLAAISSVAQSWKQPQKTIAVNVEGTLNILEGIRKNNLSPKVLMIGSSEEYAICDKPIREDYALDANNPYGISKTMQERFLVLYRERYQMQIYQVRAFNHTGVGQSSSFVLAGWCDRVAEIEISGRPGILKVGNLDVQRDFSDVRDVVRAYRMVIESDDCRTVYNVGSGKAYSLRQMVKCIISFCKQPIGIQITPELFRPADNPIICCDHQQITEKLGWKPRYTLEDTLQQMFESSKQKHLERRIEQ